MKFSIEKITEAITKNMLSMATEQEREIPSSVEEISSDYCNYDTSVRRLERVRDEESRRYGYEKLRDEICRRYHPNTFCEEVFYLADEFSRPYNRFLTYDSPPYISALPQDASASRLKRHYQAFIYILYTEVQRRLVMMPERNENENRKDDKEMISSMEEARMKGMGSYICRSIEDVESLEERRKKNKQEEKMRKMEQEKDEMSKRLDALEQEMKQVKGTFSMIGQAAMGVGALQATSANIEGKTCTNDEGPQKQLQPEDGNFSSVYNRLVLEKIHGMTLESRFDGFQLIAIYKKLSNVYVTCTEEAWLYVWGVRKHPRTGKEIKEPKRPPIWNSENGKKVALAEMIRVLKSVNCGKYWQKTAILFTYSDGSQVNASALKKYHLSGPSKREFLELLSVD